MTQTTPNKKETAINIVELYLSKWKLILLCLLIAVGFAYLKIRYSTYEYQANATIKLKQDENSKKLSEISSLQNYGMFSTDFTNVTDEVETIKSRSIISEVVKDLKLNIEYFVTGKVKEQEVYMEPPVHISFFLSDSAVNTIDKSIFIKIISADKFELSKTNNNKIIGFDTSDATTHAFGERVKADFGDFVLTPNIGTYGSTPNSYIEIKLT
ncbi:MAG: tyrosine protein kinase, partial [Gelidibacter sp.]|nr:tyrosine protein kinase [Gelidibacter sp.]